MMVDVDGSENWENTENGKGRELKEPQQGTESQRIHHGNNI